MDSLQKDHFPFTGSFNSLQLTSPLFVSPTVLISFTVLFFISRVFRTRTLPWIDFDTRRTTRSWSALTKLLILLCILVILTVVVDGSVIAAKAFNTSTWVPVLLAYYETVSFIAWVACLWLLLDELYKFGHAHWIQYTFWGVALLTETYVGWLWAMTIKRSESGSSSLTVYDQILFGAFVTRYVLQWLLIVLGIAHILSKPTSSEITPLLRQANADYGTTQQEAINTATEKQQSAFANVFKKMGELMPFIWPRNNRRLQCMIILSFSLMIFGLFINACTPFQIGYVVDHIGKGKFAWAAVLIYIGFKFLQGGSGLIQCLQNWLWIPVNQYTTREVSVKLFEHLHLLSLSFHINRKTGEVLRVMDRGTSSVVQLLSQILFQIFPAIANILVAVVVFTITFSPTYGAIVFVTMGLYLYVTISMTEWRTQFRRDMIELDNSARTKSVDSLLNFETVKYFGNSEYEINRYRDAIIEYQKADWKSSVSLNVLNLAQNTVITIGLFVGCLLFAYEVSLGRLTAGDFVVFNVYMMQLYSPLHWFGTYYRLIQSNFIDMEKMLDLLNEPQTVKDIPGAPDLFVKEGNIVFDNVTFTYDNRQTSLDGVSFTVPAGKTVALVGPSGSGKTTIMRLLFRFYDPTSGIISIDGQNIRNVKQVSLRENIGVVPQDCVLFNDTVMYNLQYGNIHASKEQVYQSAKDAQIHDKILSFPDGYETKVGERGLRLSSGEKQRIAIGRTMLKDPPIILLDEATSSLDTLTERQIQQALANVTKDRTTVVIAHRLSTIVNADLILVIKDGRVAESGTHEELLRQETTGIYWEMWQKQLREQDDSDSASTLSGVKMKSSKEDDTEAKSAISSIGVSDLLTDQQQQQQQHHQVKAEEARNPAIPVTTPTDVVEDTLNQCQTKDEVSTSFANNDKATTVQDDAETKDVSNESIAPGLPPIDIQSKMDEVPSDDVFVSSPTDKPTTSESNVDDPTSPMPVTPTETIVPMMQQGGSEPSHQQPQSQQNGNKSKSRSKNNKKKKRKSTRNSTTF